MQYGATLSRSTMNISMAKSLNPNIKANEITKGMKLYDWEKALWFSLNVNECMKLMTWWESKQHETNFHLSPLVEPEFVAYIVANISVFVNKPLSNKIIDDFLFVGRFYVPIV